MSLASGPVCHVPIFPHPTLYPLLITIPRLFPTWQVWTTTRYLNHFWALFGDNLLHLLEITTGTYIAIIYLHIVIGTGIVSSRLKRLFTSNLAYAILNIVCLLPDLHWYVTGESPFSYTTNLGSSMVFELARCLGDETTKGGNGAL